MLYVGPYPNVTFWSFVLRILSQVFRDVTTLPRTRVLFSHNPVC